MILPNALVVDVSHWQPPSSIDWAAAKGAGVVGAIVKLMQGGVPDTAAVYHLYNAYEAGVTLLGIYDFGTAQEDHVALLKQALTEFQGDVKTRLLVLDSEQNSSSQMDVAGMEDWATGVQQATGVWPTLYTGRYGPDGTGRGLPSAILSQCPLWIAAYGPHQNDLGSVLPPGWRLPINDTESAGVVRLWQMTGDGINAPEDWPAGIPAKNDLSVPIGFSSLAALTSWWNAQGAAMPGPA